MCDDCQLLTAYEAFRLYLSRGTFNRFADPKTAPHAQLTQRARYQAELKGGLYDEIGATPEQISAITQLVANSRDYLSVGGTPNSDVAEDFALAHEAAAWEFHRLRLMDHPPRTPGKALMTRFELWSVFTRLLCGFPVKSQAEFALDVAERETEEAEAEARRTRVITDLSQVTVTPPPRGGLIEREAMRAQGVTSYDHLTRHILETEPA